MICKGDVTCKCCQDHCFKEMLAHKKERLWTLRDLVGQGSRFFDEGYGEGDWPENSASNSCRLWGIGKWVIN